MQSLARRLRALRQVVINVVVFPIVWFKMYKALSGFEQNSFAHNLIQSFFVVFQMVGFQIEVALFDWPNQRGDNA